MVLVEFYREMKPQNEQRKNELGAHSAVPQFYWGLHENEIIIIEGYGITRSWPLRIFGNETLMTSNTTQDVT